MTRHDISAAAAAAEGNGIGKGNRMKHLADKFAEGLPPPPPRLLCIYFGIHEDEVF